MAPNSHLTAAQQAPYESVYPNYIPSFTPRYPHSPEHIRRQQKYEFEIENVDEKELEDVIQYLNEKIKKYHFSLDTFPT